MSVKKVLVVDDEASIREMLRLALEISILSVSRRRISTRRIS